VFILLFSIAIIQSDGRSTRGSTLPNRQCMRSLFPLLSSLFLSFPLPFSLTSAISCHFPFLLTFCPSFYLSQVGEKAKKVHPMWRTTASAYGAKPIEKHALPSKTYGRRGLFSKEFGGCGNFRSHSLNTTKSRSKAMPDPSFGTTGFFEV
jgi:hypothetical protein